MNKRGMPNVQSMSGQSITTSAVSAVLFTANVQGYERLAFRIAPVSQNLTALSIQAKIGAADSNYVTLFSAAGDFTSPAGLVKDASGDLTKLAAASTGWCVLDVSGLTEIRVNVTAAGAGTCGYSYSIN